MGQFTFETQGTNTYLVYNVGEDEQIDSMSLGMITNNKIPGLAPTIFTQLDTSKFVKFNVSAKISVNQFFSGPVNKKRLLGVFEGIVDAMLSAEDYMIDPNSIMLDLNYIFADVSTCETVLVCLPIVKDSLEQPVDLGTFFKNIMFGTQFDQTENCDHVAKIMNYLNSAPVFSLSVFKEVLESISGNVAPVAPTYAAPVAQPAATPVQTTPISQPASAPVRSAPVSQPVKTAPVQAPPVAQPVATPVQTAPASQPAAAPVQAPVEKKTAFAIPGKGNKASTPAKVTNSQAQNQPKGEKPMSMMYLLQHYSKENAALYKAQKEAAKNGGEAPAVAPAAQAQPTKAQAKPATAFAIPGQAAPAVTQTQPAKAQAQPATAFAIPGQAAPAVNVAPAQPRPVTQPAAAPVQAVPVAAPVAPQSAGIPMNFGETTVLGGAGMGETTVLGAVSQEVKATPHLIRAKNSEKININKPVFRIGKEKSYVDYFIADNTAISRSHANIVEKDGAYYAVDTNSTNHTYVNEVMIQSNVEVKLEHGAKLRLANENFEFRLY